MRSLLTIFRFVWPYLKKLRGLIFWYFLTAILSLGLNNTAPTYVLGLFLDGLTGGTLTTDQLLRYCGIFVGIFLVNLLLSYIHRMMSARVTVRGWAAMAQQIYQRLQKASPRALAGKNTAELVSRINSDVNSLVGYLMGTGTMGLGMALIFVLTLSFVFYLDVWCGLIALSSVPMMLLMNKRYGDKIAQASGDKAQARDQFVSSLDEQLRSVRSIRLGSLFGILGKRYTQRTEELEKSYIKYQKVVYPYAMFQANLGDIMTIVLMVYASWAILQGRFTPGQFIIINTYFSLIVSCMSYFISVSQNAQEYLALYRRLKELSDIPQEGNGSELPTPLENITAEGLSFSYTEGEPVLENLSQTFEKDKIYCLAGRNGSGKSTLADVLLGLYVSDADPSVKYNGVPLQDVDLYEMRANHTGVSEQEPMMLRGSIGFNITCREDGAGDRERLRELLEMVDFRKGEVDTRDLEALLALDANELSGGQKQKVSIVKALYKDPELLVMDEPTSALDAESRRRLAGYLKAHAKGRITILVSHDQELLDIADEVVCLGKEQVAGGL